MQVLRPLPSQFLLSCSRKGWLFFSMVEFTFSTETFQCLHLFAYCRKRGTGCRVEAPAWSVLTMQAHSTGLRPCSWSAPTRQAPLSLFILYCSSKGWTERREVQAGYFLTGSLATLPLERTEAPAARLFHDAGILKGE